MKTSVQRLAAMSVAFLLLCATVVAQNVNDIKSVTGDSYNKMRISPNPVVLFPDGEAYVTVVLEPGYYHPIVIYKSKSYEMGQSFSGAFFRVEYSAGVVYSFKIIADKNAVAGQTDFLDFEAEEIPVDDELSKSIVRIGIDRLVINIVEPNKI